MMTRRNLLRFINVLAIALLLTAPALAAPITLRVDATQALRRIFYADETIPVTPGPLTLVYPKWIPGEHGPTGPITDLAGLKLSASGKSIEWKRDAVDMYAFHLTVPAGATSLDMKLELLSTPGSEGFSSAASATSELAVLSWNQLLLYPEGKPTNDVEFTAELKLPADWKFGTSLPVLRNAANNTIDFKTVSLTTLVDSPVLAGKHFRRIELSPGATPPHYLDIAADSDEALEVSPERVAKYRQLVKEALAMFGNSTHYREYHFLLALSDQIAHFGLEHHESSDDQAREVFLTDDAVHLAGSSLLPHEFVHSWNGKFRRPQGLATPDYQTPMKGELLWVYEGLTEYLGWVLTARAGLDTAEQNRQFLAVSTAALDNRSGREWRPLIDTTIAAQLLYNARSDWDSERRGVDFYDEGLLIWLEADTIIRKQSQGEKSLEDFLRAFHGGPSTNPEVKPYTFESLAESLGRIVNYDWKKFFDERLNRTGTEHAPQGGIEAGGYRLTYADKMADVQKTIESVSGSISVAYSIGLKLGTDGNVTDVLPELAAAKSGVGPGMKIVAVNGNQFSGEVLRQAIRGTKTGGTLDLLVQNGKRFSSYKLDYRGGERYPMLEPNGLPKLLDEILKPLSK